MRVFATLLLAVTLAAPALARDRGDGNGKGDPQDDKRCPVVTCEPCACPDPGPTPAPAPCECDEAGCRRCEQGGCTPCAPECLPTAPACPTITVAPVDCGVRFPIYAPCRARKNGKVREGDVVVAGVPYKCPRRLAPHRFFVPVR